MHMNGVCYMETLKSSLILLICTGKQVWQSGDDELVPVEFSVLMALFNVMKSHMQSM